MAHLRVADADARERRTWTRPFWGIRSDDADDSTPGRARAFAPRLPERAFYFGSTAAALHGLPLPWRMATASELHIGVRAGDRRVECSGVIAHHVTIADADLQRTDDGLPVTTPARTWCDLASQGLSRADLIAVGDRLLWRHDPLTDAVSLRRALARYEGRRGSRLLRDALPYLSDRADSAPESALRVAIVDAGLPAPAVNPIIRDVSGRFVAQVDLMWAAEKVIIEYEGDYHRTDREQWHRDLERFGRLQELGWLVLRATSADYRDPARLIAQLSRLLANRRRESTDFTH